MPKTAFLFLTSLTSGVPDNNFRGIPVHVLEPIFGNCGDVRAFYFYTLLGFPYSVGGNDRRNNAYAS
jgi:hypothetical protein